MIENAELLSSDGFPSISLILIKQFVDNVFGIVQE